MELVESIVPQLSRRSRSLVVRHTAAGLLRCLEPGEAVVVHDPTSGDYWAGAVADVDFEVADTVYRVELGVRLPEDHARERIGAPVGHGALTEETVDMQDLLDLLGAARAERSRTRPAPATAQRLATDAALRSLVDQVRRSL